MRLWVRGPGAYELDGVPQGSVDVVLTVGDARLCGSFGGKIRRDDGRLLLAAFAPAPPACADIGGTPVPSTATPTPDAPDSGSTASSQVRIMPWSAAEGFDVDWFRVDAADDFSGDFSFVVTLSGLPANDYRLTVYRGAPPGSSDTYECGFLCLSSCGYPASKQATSGGAASVTVTLDEGSLCSDDSGTFYISVEQLSGSPACANFTLTARDG